jgi:uncharacterized SAM-binding protein YcdF (DUF218 family)
MTAPRLVAVLGYSNGRSEDLHEICAARLRRAEHEIRDGDVVLLSGWSRGRQALSEADLMARSWSGPPSRLVLDRGARSTLGNAVATARSARELRAAEIVLVTSSWHGRRARSLLRAALDGSDATVSVALADGRASFRHRARESVCWLGVPVQRVVARRRSRQAGEPGPSAPC